MIASSCLCGEVGWAGEGPLEFLHHCHCSRCRKTHGVAFGSYGALAAEGFRWLRGKERLRRFESSPGFVRCFCGRCGSMVPGDSQGERVFLPAGCIDGDPGARPVAHIFVASKAPWHRITGDLPRFDTYPPEVEAPVLPDGEPPRARAGYLGGSCLCGGVAFEIEGRIDAIRNCHCGRCRKARSAAHASNLFVEPARFRWTRGESSLEAYKIPEAERFKQVFCRECGSPLPNVNRERGYVVVPAGSLDGDPGAREVAHIFVGSKAPWYEITDDLPRFEEYPPGQG